MFIDIEKGNVASKVHSTVDIHTPSPTKNPKNTPHVSK